LGRAGIFGEAKTSIFYTKKRPPLAAHPNDVTLRFKKKKT
jgi:hypothetical protein